MENLIRENTHLRVQIQMFSGFNLEGKIFPHSSINQSGAIPCGFHSEELTFTSTDNFLQMLHSLAAISDAYFKFQVKFIENDRRMNSCFTPTLQLIN